MTGLYIFSSASLKLYPQMSEVVSHFEQIHKALKYESECISKITEYTRKQMELAGGIISKTTMQYKDAYIFLFNQLSDLMENRPELTDDIIRIQQQAEEIVLESEE